MKRRQLWQEGRSQTTKGFESQVQMKVLNGPVIWSLGGKASGRQSSCPGEGAECDWGFAWELPGGRPPV